jgi:hypothetical protein
MGSGHFLQTLDIKGHCLSAGSGFLGLAADRLLTARAQDRLACRS